MGRERDTTQGARFHASRSRSPGEGAPRAALGRRAGSERVGPAALAAALLLAFSLPAGAEPAAIAWSATVQSFGTGTSAGPQAPVLLGERVEIVALVDPTVAPSPATPQDPRIFSGALLSLELHFPESDVLFAFGAGGLLPNTISLTNDAGSGTRRDQITITTVDVVEAPPLAGAQVAAATIVLSESITPSQGGGIPDLLIASDSLPTAGVDLESPGTLVSNVSFTYQGFRPSSVLFSDIRPLPEPLYGGVAAIGVLAFLGRRRGLLARVPGGIAPRSGAARSGAAPAPWESGGSPQEEQHTSHTATPICRGAVTRSNATAAGRSTTT